MPDDPAFFHHSQSSDHTRPMWVTGFVFDPATRTIDFSAVPGFDLKRVREILHIAHGSHRSIFTCLYSLPLPQLFPFGLAEVDGVPVPSPQWVQPTSGKVLKLKVSCEGMLPSDALIVVYDPPSGG